MDDLARTLIECAGAKRCSECEGYPSCGGVLNLMLSAAREIERLKDKTTWRPAENPPKGEEFVLVKVSGRYKNIRLDGAVTTGAYYGAENGWELEVWPEWEEPGVTAWMPLPD